MKVGNMRQARRMTGPNASVIALVILVLTFFSSAHSERKTDDIDDLYQCGRGKQVLIREAYFNEYGLCNSDTDSLCETNPLVNCSECSGHCHDCEANFALPLISQIYDAVDSPNESVKAKVTKEMDNIGCYTIHYECVDSRKDTVDPCGDTKTESTDMNTIFLWGSWSTPCQTECNVKFHDTRKANWEHQFLLRNGASTEDIFVSYQIVFYQESMEWKNMTPSYLLGNTICDRKNQHKIKMMKLKFTISDVKKVSRIFLRFKDKVQIQCWKQRQHPPQSTWPVSSSVSVVTTAATNHTPEVYTLRPGYSHRHRFHYFFIVPAILAFLAVIVCLAVVMTIKSEKHARRSPETTHMLRSATTTATTPDRSPHPHTPLNDPHNHYFQNQAFDDQHQTLKHTVLPPLVGHVTGSGSDDRKYDTLDHHGGAGGRRGRGRREDDYSHVCLLGSSPGEGGYESVQLGQPGRRIAIGNPYDHPS
ncbi:hypothetical protein ACOMHN_006865 [Nucella lapillus]